MKRRIEKLIVPGILVLGLTACNQEAEPHFRVTDPQAIKITVSNHGGLVTKAEENSGAVLFEDVYLGKVSEEDSLLVSAYVEENLTIPFELEEELTKGTINDVDVLKNSSFILHGWLDFDKWEGEDLKGQSDSDKENYHFINSASVSYSDGKWSINQQCMWRSNVPSSFWSYYPSSLTTLATKITWPGKTASHDDQGCVSFDYALPLPSSDTDKTSAVKTQDILFAYNYQKVKFGEDPKDTETYGKAIDGTSDYVDIHFYHTMAAVRFDISRLVAAGVEIKEIFVEDVVKEGSCVVSAVGTDGVTFAWDVDYSKKSGKLIQAYSGTDFKGKGLVNDGDVKNPEKSLQTDGSKFFFFMPQTVEGKGIKIGLTYTGADGLPKSAETTISHKPWEAGKLYTYKLSTTSDLIDVEVEDEVEKFNKNNLSITNTGTTVEYIRALLIGAYCETDKTKSKQEADKGAIVYSWDPDDPDLGTFDGFPGEDWVKGSDGFWYYTKPVDPAEATSQLFQAYHAYYMPPVGDSHLEINIAAQAVAYDEDKSIVTETWGVDEIIIAGDKSKKTIKDALKIRQ